MSYMVDIIESNILSTSKSIHSESCLSKLLNQEL